MLLIMEVSWRSRKTYYSRREPCRRSSERIWIRIHVRLLRSLRRTMAVSSVVVGRTADRQANRLPMHVLINPSRDSAFGEIVMADAVGLALGCVGLSLLMSLSSVPTRLGRHMSSLADMLLVGCCVRVLRCSSMVQFRSVHHQCCSRGGVARSRTVAVRHCRMSGCYHSSGYVVCLRFVDRSSFWCSL